MPNGVRRMRWRREESCPKPAPLISHGFAVPASPRGEAFDSLHRAKAFPSRGDSPLCGEMSAEQTKGSEGFQNFLLFAKPQLAGMARRGKAPALRRTCGSIPFRSNEKGLPGLNRKSFSFVKREKEMKMRGFANGVPLWNIFIIPAN